MCVESCVSEFLPAAVCTVGAKSKMVPVDPCRVGAVCRGDVVVGKQGRQTWNRDGRGGGKEESQSCIFTRRQC